MKKKSLDKVLTEHYKKNKKDVQKVLCGINLSTALRDVMEENFKKTIYAKSPEYEYFKGIKKND